MPTASTSVELSISNDNDTDCMSISLNGIEITEENLLDGIVDPPVSIQSLVTQIILKNFLINQFLQVLLVQDKIFVCLCNHLTVRFKIHK